MTRTRARSRLRKWVHVACGCAAAVAMVGWCIVAVAAEGPLWRKPFAADISALSLPQEGVALVLSKAGLVAVDPATGAQRWAREDATEFAHAGSRSVFIETRGHQAVLDVMTGRERWNTSSLKLHKFKESLLPDPHGPLLLASETASGGHSLVAVTFETGEVLWRQNELFSGPGLSEKAKGVRYHDALLQGGILILDPSYGGLLHLDPATGRLRGRTSGPKIKVSDPLSTGAAPMLLHSGHVHVASRSTLLTIDVTDGKVLWRLNDDLPTPVFQMETTEKGLLVRGAYNMQTSSNGMVRRRKWKPYLALLDDSSGKVVWSTLAEKPSFEGRSSFLLQGDSVIIAANDGLVVRELATGRVVRSATYKEPKEGDDFCCIAPNGNRFVLSSRENLRLVDLEGKVYYDRYFKAPGVGALMKLAAVAAASTGGAIGTALASTVVLNERFGTSDASGGATYFFTESPTVTGRTGFSLVRVDDASGDERGRVWFTERSPLYQLDASTGRVVVAEGKTLYAMEFPRTEDR